MPSDGRFCVLTLSSRVTFSQRLGEVRYTICTDTDIQSQEDLNQHHPIEVYIESVRADHKFCGLCFPSRISIISMFTMVLSSVSKSFQKVKFVECLSTWHLLFPGLCLFCCCLLSVDPFVTRKTCTEISFCLKQCTTCNTANISCDKSSGWRQKGLTGCCFKCIDRPFCLGADEMCHHSLYFLRSNCFWGLF